MNTLETIHWFYLTWNWMGFGASVVLLILLFKTDLLRGNAQISRRHDKYWLAWFSAVSYLFHNVEEYGIDLNGVRYAFPQSEGVAQMYGQIHEINHFYIFVVNLSVVWIGGHLMAYLSRKYQLRIMPSVMASFMILNAITHCMLLTYNPGLLTGLVIFIPLGLWVLYVNFFKQQKDIKGVLASFGISAAITACLFATALWESANPFGMMPSALLLLGVALCVWLAFKCDDWLYGKR